MPAKAVHSPIVARQTLTDNNFDAVETDIENGLFFLIYVVLYKIRRKRDVKRKIKPIIEKVEVMGKEEADTPTQKKTPVITVMANTSQAYTPFTKSSLYNSSLKTKEEVSGDDGSVLLLVPPFSLLSSFFTYTLLWATFARQHSDDMFT
jgi:hypothetical protein